MKIKIKLKILNLTSLKLYICLICIIIPMLRIEKYDYVLYPVFGFISYALKNANLQKKLVF
jgi:hypothetical protein